jgi:CDP-glucose 4,6-dehydratase
LRAIEAGQPAHIRSPNAIRPWQHVLEPLCGYLTLAEKLYAHGPTYAEGWNFGPLDGDAKPVQSIVDLFTRLWGEGATWTIDNEPQPHEAAFLRLDSEKVRSRLGWKPRWNIDHAVENVIEWHKACRLGADMRDVTLAQINKYQNS